MTLPPTSARDRIDLSFEPPEITRGHFDRQRAGLDLENKRRHFSVTGLHRGAPLGDKILRGAVGSTSGARRTASGKAKRRRTSIDAVFMPTITAPTISSAMAPAGGAKFRISYAAWTAAS